MKKHISYIIIVLLLLVSPVFVTAVDRADYNSALVKYKNNENKAALSLFQKFMSENPNSVKADDALWYTGRLFGSMDQIDNAKESFRTVISDQSSNRFDEASYDLGQILYSEKRYSEVIELLKFTTVDSFDALGSYYLKGRELSAKAWYRLAYIEKFNYNEKKSIELFKTSLSLYEDLENMLIDEADLSRIHFSMAKIYSHLTDLTYNSKTYQEYLAKNMKYVQLALPLISDFYRPEAEKMLVDPEKSKKIGYNGRLVASAGADSLSANTIGAVIKARASITVPIRNRTVLTGDINFKHDSFDFVASNFDKTKTGDAQLVQYKNIFGADLALKTGTRRDVYNKIKLFSDFQLAEDIRDNYISAGVSDLGSFRFNSKWRFDWKSKFEWRTYPNYLISGRKLDYIEGYIDPSIKYYGLDWVDISLIYGIDVKQYLDSKYDTIDPTVTSTLNKLNLYNSGELVFDFKASKVYNPSLSYKINYLKTFNYDYWVSGTPSNRFITAYYDYLSHSISFDNNFNINKQLKVFFGSNMVFTNFINYPARDATKTFIDEIRKDIEVKLDLGANYVFWTSPQGTEYEARLTGWYDYKVSNMTYNTTFDTNYSFAGLTLGLSVKIP